MDKNDFLYLLLGKNYLHGYSLVVTAHSGHPFVQLLPLYRFPRRVSTESFNPRRKSDNERGDTAFWEFEEARRCATNLAAGDLSMG
jgi:hypothetical protein